VLAEGTETIEQVDFLRQEGCKYVQGYYYSRPLPEKEYIAYISSITANTTIK
jgi:sensor c-di-GMP phosphodiesterase-like protein